jgi:CMP-N-acetylneuraminic acid synthetase
MYKGKTIFGLIPARAGSKGLPRKNIMLLLGKPLIAWTIEQCLTSKYLDKVVLSTDNMEIAEISKKYGVEVPFLRPKELARDDSSIIDVIIHALNWLEKTGENFDYLALLEPTSPIREKENIDFGIKKLIDNRKIADSLVSIGEIALEHPSISKKIVEKGYIKPFYEINELIVRRQDLPKAYFPYGVLYLSKITALKKYKTFYQKRTLSLFIKRWQNYEINDIWDFCCVEAILRKLKEEQKK